MWHPLTPPPNAPCGLKGRIVFSNVLSQTNPHTCTKFGANRSSRLTASPDIWICDPLNPPRCPRGIVRRLVFSLCPFPDESADVNQSWCQSVQPFDSFFRLLNVWPPCVSNGNFLAYIHSQMNLNMCAKFGANRSSRLTASTDFWICDPLKKNAPWGIEGLIAFGLCLFPDESADVYQIWCESVRLFDSFPRLLNLWHPKPPWGTEWRIVFSLCPFPDESADLYQIWCQSVQPFDSFPKHLNLWPPNPPPPNAPGVLWDELYLAYYVHSQTNPPTCTKFGANRCSRLTASPVFWICDP